MQLTWRLGKDSTTWHIQDAFVTIEEMWDNDGNQYTNYTHFKKSKIEGVIFSTPRPMPGGKEGTLCVKTTGSERDTWYPAEKESEVYAFYLELLKIVSEA